MFVDEVDVRVAAGDGGRGCIAFRREKFVPRGGPSGGDGGDGGSVILLASPHVNTLVMYRYHPEFRAQRGQHGMGSNCHGKNGKDLLLDVAVGTTVLVVPEEGGEPVEVADLTTAGERFVIAAGGQGGRGNARFASATNRAPRRADPGVPGEIKLLRLKLKLLADVGLVGFPNAGKSTLIARISAAKPKIADYPFTTLTPHLGVVALSGNRSFVVADVPGLIEGAHRGLGLGHQFLRHLERTRVLIHMIDVSGATGRDPVVDFETIRRELELYRPEFADKPQLAAANKIDVVADPDA
ncbi:MAG: GTPase ObgE, partial [Acidobacteriota bacterium]